MTEKKKKSISISSRKGKARRLQKWIAEKVSNLLNIPWGPDELIASREMGQSGVDIRLVGDALKLFPWSVEAKNQERFSVPDWIEQAKSNKIEGTEWLLIVSKNHYDKLAILDAEVFFKLLEKIEGNVKGI